MEQGRACWPKDGDLNPPRTRSIAHTRVLPASKPLRGWHDRPSGRAGRFSPSTRAASIICSWFPRTTRSKWAHGSFPLIQLFAWNESGPRSTRSPRLMTRSCSPISSPANARRSVAKCPCTSPTTRSRPFGMRPWSVGRFCGTDVFRKCPGVSSGTVQDVGDKVGDENRKNHLFS